MRKAKRNFNLISVSNVKTQHNCNAIYEKNDVYLTLLEIRFL